MRGLKKGPSQGSAGVQQECCFWPRGRTDDQTADSNSAFGCWEPAYQVLHVSNSDIKRRPRAHAPKAAQCQPGIISGTRFLSRVPAAGSPGARGSPFLETQLFKLQKRTRAADNFRPSYTQLKRPLSGKRARTQRSEKHIDFVGRYRKSR